MNQRGGCFAKIDGLRRPPIQGASSYSARPIQTRSNSARSGARTYLARAYRLRCRRTWTVSNRFRRPQRESTLATRTVSRESGCPIERQEPEARYAQPCSGQKIRNPAALTVTYGPECTPACALPVAVNLAKPHLP